jgi:RNA polymerase sigma factor (sigma-70 family)
MNAALSIEAMTREQDRRISAAVEQEQSRLRKFIRRRVPDPGDAEDVLQDVFYELVEAYRLMKPIEQVGAWLFRVARNRITDRFRKKKSILAGDLAEVEESPEVLSLEELLPSPDAGPDAAYARSLLLEEIEEAIEELPDEQREVFVAHEFEGRSFKELAAESGVSMNTLLSRKHYAVLYLRGRLREIYDDLVEG